MAGYCIGLYKYMRVDENLAKRQQLMESRKCSSQQQDSSDDEKHRKFLAFGEFDRIGFERIEKFSKFRDISVSGKEWIGDRQVHLIYEIPSEKSRDYETITYYNGNFYYNGGDGAIASSHLFVGITVLQFKDSIRHKANELGLEKVLQKFREEILNTVKDDPGVKCEVFGTLGSFGVTIIWLADQYTSILNSVTKVRNHKVEENESISDYLSAYTILARNHKQKDDYRWDERVAGIEGKAMLRITLKKGINDTIKEELNKLCESIKCTYHCAGEYDLTMIIPSQKAFEIFEKGKLLSSDADFYKNYVLQTNVQLCESINLETDGRANDDRNAGNRAGNNVVINNLKDIQSTYKKLRSEFKDSYSSSAGMIDTLDLLYSDYISKISTASNEMWVSIFSYQFLHVLNIILRIMEAWKHRAGNEYLHAINDLLNDFSVQISHIAESNNLVLGTPTCQFRYSGQNNLTLFAYFGYIKYMLGMVYEKQNISRQSEIIPFLVTDVVPIITSRNYEYSANINSQIGSVVTIKLPMVSLYHPIGYQPYLTHEIFHYVTPCNKYERNQIFGCIYAIEILLSSFKMLINKEINNDSSNLISLSREFVGSVLIRYVYNFVVEYYVEYIGSDIELIAEPTVQFADLNKKVSGAIPFGKRTTEQWIKWLNNENKGGIHLNPIYHCMEYLVQNREIILNRDLQSMLQRMRDRESVNVFTDGVKGFFDKAEAVVDNREDEAKSKAYNIFTGIWNEHVLYDANQIIANMREGMADISMVELNHMSETEYLITLTKTKKELLIDPGTDKFELQDIIRSGMVMDCLETKQHMGLLTICDVELYRNDFYDLYYGMYCKHDIIGNWGKKYQELEKESQQWFEYWRKCYVTFQRQYSVFKGLFRKLYMQNLMFDFNEKEVNLWKNYADKLRSFGNYIRMKAEKDDACQKEEAYKCFEKDVFDLNVEFIHTFYSQKEFEELNENRAQIIDDNNNKEIKIDNEFIRRLKLDCSVVPLKSPVRFTDPIEFSINSVGELSETVSRIAYIFDRAHTRVLGKREYPIWYRGHQSEKYVLIPSVMRKYKDAKNKSLNNKMFSLDIFLKQEYEEFKYRADGTQEAIERTAYKDADYLALMQHYGVPSNLLDWTEDAMSALYFALESFLDDEKPEINEDAALYMFSPELYNYARVRIVEEERCQEPYRKVRVDYDYMNGTIQEGIPNLTTEYNAERFYMYLLGKDCIKGIDLFIADSQTRKLAMNYYLPLAVYVSKLNRRIQAQSGIFTAFHIYTSPDDNDSFDYMSLENVQEMYLKNFSDKDKVCPFLYKIKIEKSVREKIAKWVKTFGMTKEKCYPELENIGKRIMR